MTTVDWSSSPESSMDDDGSAGDNSRGTLTKTKAKSTSFNIATADKTGHSRGGGGFRAEDFGEQLDADADYADAGDNFSEKGDAEIWCTFTENLHQVQSVLDQNSSLIQQVNKNHQSLIYGNLVKNVALIQEINGNMSKVVSLYSDLSVDFSRMFHRRSGSVDAKNNDGKGDTVHASAHQLQ
ncbi:hypothetical protein U1Q18_026267 [Sarracenia purpurea var. burkii]